MSNQTIMGDILTKHDYVPEFAMKRIFEAQKAFGGKFIPFDKILEEVAEGDTVSRDFYLEDIGVCCMDELSEILGWLPWKHWKNYEGFEIQLTELRFEFVDILHFGVELCLISEVKPEELRFLTFESPLKDLLLGPMGNKLVASSIKGWVADFIRALGRTIDKGQSEKDLKEAVISLMTVLFVGFRLMDMSPIDVYDYYMSKNKENFARQERGY